MFSIRTFTVPKALCLLGGIINLVVAFLIVTASNPVPFDGAIDGGFVVLIFLGAYPMQIGCKIFRFYAAFMVAEGFVRWRQAVERATNDAMN